MTLFREGFSGEAFLLCVAAGFFSAAVCDVVHALCRVFSAGRLTVAVADLFSCLFVTAVAFIVSLPVGFGQIRFFQILAELPGAAVYMLLFGNFTKLAVLMMLRSGCALKKCANNVRIFLCGKHPCSKPNPKRKPKRSKRKKIGKTRKFP